MVTMNKRPTKFGCTIPELKDVISKYGCGLGSPPYIIFGQYNSPTTGPMAGILAAATNQIHAYIIRREINKNGTSTVYRTEFHPNTNFSIAKYKDGLRQKIEAQKKEQVEDKRRAQYPAPRIVAWSGNAKKDK
jgi:hypothetical protein